MTLWHIHGNLRFLGQLQFSPILNKILPLIFIYSDVWNFIPIFSYASRNQGISYVIHPRWLWWIFYMKNLVEFTSAYSLKLTYFDNYFWYHSNHMTRLYFNRYVNLFLDVFDRLLCILLHAMSAVRLLLNHLVKKYSTIHCTKRIRKHIKWKWNVTSLWFRFCFLNKMSSAPTTHVNVYQLL